MRTDAAGDQRGGLTDVETGEIDMANRSSLAFVTFSWNLYGEQNQRAWEVLDRYREAPAPTDRL